MTIANNTERQEVSSWSARVYGDALLISGLKHTAESYAQQPMVVEVSSPDRQGGIARRIVDRAMQALKAR